MALDTELAAWSKSDCCSAEAVEQLCHLGYTSLSNLGATYGGVAPEVKYWDADDSQQLEQLKGEAPALLPLQAMKLLKMLGKHKGKKAKKGGSAVSTFLFVLSLIVIITGMAVGHVTIQPVAERQLYFDKAVDIVNRSIGIDLTPIVDQYYYTVFPKSSGEGEGVASISSGATVVFLKSSSIIDLSELLKKAHDYTIIDLQGRTVVGPLAKAMDVRADNITIRRGTIETEPRAARMLKVLGNGFRLEEVTIKGDMGEDSNVNGFESTGLVQLLGTDNLIRGCNIEGGDTAVSVEGEGTAEVVGCHLTGIAVNGKKTKLTIRNCKVHGNQAMGVVMEEGAHCEMHDTLVYNNGGEGVAATTEGTLLIAHNVNISDNLGGGLWVGEGAEAELYDCHMAGDESVVAIGGSQITLNRCTSTKKPEEHAGATVIVNN